ncbi:MAG: hypothetical protein R6U98_14950 [Pirellulaceae bacterium]
MSRPEKSPTQAVLPLVGLAAEKVIRDRYEQGHRQNVPPIVVHPPISPRAAS